ncbi:MAG: type II toxin-antitoxin system HicB family antitoxin [Chloroflexota bacterium]
MSRYAVVIEKGESGFGAYVPDLPVCVALGKTEAKVRRLIHEAIAFHIGELRAAGEPIPSPTSAVEFVEA